MDGDTSAYKQYKRSSLRVPYAIRCSCIIPKQLTGSLPSSCLPSSPVAASPPFLNCLLLA
ncbi:unnamed protein product, partial [Heterotrigona itama]